MAYVDPQTIQNPTANSNRPTASWGDQLRANDEYFARLPGCVITRSTAQSITTGSGQAISFDAEQRDQGGFWVIGSPTRMTVPTGEGGWYMAGGEAAFAANASTTTYRYLYPRVGGSTNKGGALMPVNSSSVGTHLNVNVPILLSAGNYVELIAEQNSGGGINLDSAFPIVGWLLKLSLS